MKIAIAFLFVILAAASGAAHPLGIFSVNRYTRIEIAGDSLRLIYVTDIAEVPTINELKKLDLNRDGTYSPEEKETFCADKVRMLLAHMSIMVDGNPAALRLSATDLSFPVGQGGLTTIRMTDRFSAQLPADHRRHVARYVDNNFDDVRGWKEILVRCSDGVSLIAGTASQNDITDELRSYPQDRLSDLPDDHEATIEFIPGDVSVHEAGNTVSAVSRARDSFAELISARELTPGFITISLLLALMLGAGHALTPGHGKTVVAAYLVGSRGTAKHAALLGITVTLTHTVGVFAMGLLALFASQYILPDKLFPWLGCASGLIVVVIGVVLFRRRFVFARSGSIRETSHTHSEEYHHLDHAHDHTHEETTHSHGGRVHTHLPPGADGTPVTWKNLIALGVSGGLLPCPSAIVVMLSAIALGRIAFGLLLILFFSIGLAAVLTGIGLMMVFARGFFERFKTDGLLARWIPVVSSFVITVAGAVIAFQAFAQTGLHIPWESFAKGSLRDVAGSGIFTVLSFGFVLGLKHALDADHLVAVSTIVSERKGIWSSSIVGALWGLGHTASLFIVGLIVIAAGIKIPDKAALAMEFGVALMLIILGANVLRKFFSGGRFHLHAHAHGGHLHLHPHIHEKGAVHRAEGHHASGIMRRVSPMLKGKRPLIIGMVHGMAGSAALMLIVLATIPSPAVGLMYIGVFGIGSIGGMLIMSTLIGIPFAVTARASERLHDIVRLSSGFFGFAFGLYYAYQIGIIGGLFTGSPM